MLTLKIVLHWISLNYCLPQYFPRSTVCFFLKSVVLFKFSSLFVILCTVMGMAKNHAHQLLLLFPLWLLTYETKFYMPQFLFMSWLVKATTGKKNKKRNIWHSWCNLNFWIFWFIKKKKVYDLVKVFWHENIFFVFLLPVQY